MNKAELLQGWREAIQKVGGKQRFEHELLPHLDEATKTAYEYVRAEV